MCARCGRPIVPGTDWDLDHGPDRLSYLGPSHRRCNRSNGAAVTNSRRTTTQPTAKFRWSRNWNAPDPVPDYAVVLGDD